MRGLVTAFAAACVLASGPAGVALGQQTGNEGGGNPTGGGGDDSPVYVLPLAPLAWQQGNQVMNPFANAALPPQQPAPAAAYQQPAQVAATYPVQAQQPGFVNPNPTVQPVSLTRPAVFAETEAVVYHDPESGPVYHHPVPEGGYPEFSFHPEGCDNCDYM